jgi:hypothetical protein
MIFIYKGNDSAREKVLEHHKGLRPYLEEKPKKDRRELDLLEAAKEKFKEAKEKKESTASTNTSIRPVVPSSLGVNIVVSGKVEVVFRFIK